MKFKPKPTYFGKKKMEQPITQIAASKDLDDVLKQYVPEVYQRALDVVNAMARDNKKSVRQEFTIEDLKSMEDSTIEHPYYKHSEDRQLLLVKTKWFLVSIKLCVQENIIQYIAFLLLRGRVEEEFYDLINRLLASVETVDCKAAFHHLETFTKRVSEKQYLRMMRSMVFEAGESLPHLVNLFWNLHLILNDFYGDGFIRLFDEERDVVIRCSPIPGVMCSFLDLWVVSVGQLSVLYNQLIQSNDITFSGAASMQMYELVNRRFANYFKSFRLGKKDCHFIITRLPRSIGTLMFNCIFNQTLDKGSSCLRFIREREDVGEDASVFITFMQIFFDKLFPRDLLVHRNCYVGKQGVLFHLATPFDDAQIEYVYLYEVHTENYHYVYVRALGKREELEFMIDMVDLLNSTRLWLSDLEYQLALGVLTWYGLGQQMRELVETKLVDTLKDLAEEQSAEFSKGDEFLKSSLLQVLDEIDVAFSEDNITYEDPTSWNYSRKGLKQSNASNGGKRVTTFERKIVIDSYTRRLAPGQKASEEAKEAASKVFLELGDDKTFVRSFERTQSYSVQADEMSSF